MSDHGAAHGQPMGRPPLPMRNPDTNSTTRVPPYHVAMIKREPDPSDYFEMRPASIRGMAIAGPVTSTTPAGAALFQAGGAHPTVIGLPRGDEWGRKSSRYSHRHSPSTASSSTVEINDHIYHTIDQLQFEDEAYHSPTEITDDMCTGTAVTAHAQNVQRPRLLCRSSQNLRGPLLSESIAKPKTPPPRLLNSPKSTACLKTSKLPLVPSSQSVRIISSSVTTTPGAAQVTADTVTVDQETTRESPPRPTADSALDLKQKQHKAQSPETNDYVSLCSTPRTSTVM